MNDRGQTVPEQLVTDMCAGQCQIEDVMSEVANTSDARGMQAGNDGAQGGPTTNRRGNRLPRDERRGQLLIAAGFILNQPVA